MEIFTPVEELVVSTFVFGHSGKIPGRVVMHFRHEFVFDDISWQLCPEFVGFFDVGRRALYAQNSVCIFTASGTNGIDKGLMIGKQNSHLLCSLNTRLIGTRKNNVLIKAA